MRRILITGATGFLGKNVLEHMNFCDTEVWAVGRHCPDLREGLFFYECDLRNELCVQECLNHIKPDVLVLLAWDVSTQSYWESFENHIWTDASVRMAHAFLAQGGRHILFAGTSASYDYSLEWLKETSEYEKPNTLYGISKLYTSNAISRLAERYGATYCEARLFAIYGTHEKRNRLIPLTAYRLMQGECVVNKKGDLLRDYIHVEDAARAVNLLLEKKASGVYNVSSGEAVSIRRIVEEVAQVLERQEYVQFDETDFEGEFPRIVGDNSKLIQLGFEYRYDIISGIRAAVEWLKMEEIV